MNECENEQPAKFEQSKNISKGNTHPRMTMIIVLHLHYIL